MRILVTGGGGFIGRRLVSALISRGDQVVAIDGVFESNSSPKRGLTLCKGDVTDPDIVNGIFRLSQFDAVIHGAAVVGVMASLDAPRRTFEVNLLGSLHVLEAMRRSAVRRFIHISSNEVYGDTGAGPVSEEHSLDPLMPYGISKAAVEQLGRSYARLYGMECINLRGAWVYGPDLKRKRLPNLMLDEALRERKVSLATGGESVMDYIHVDDFVTACLRILDHAEHRYDAYNVGSGVGTSVKELAARVQALLPGVEIVVGSGHYEFAPGLPMRKQGPLDISRLHSVVGFAPKVALQAGLREIVESRRGNHPLTP